MAGTRRRSDPDIFSADVVRRVDGVLRVVNHIIAAHSANPEGFEAPDESR